MPAPARRRDSVRTRERLIAAAMQRFGSEGFAAARVRDIGNDAGVDPALINRYFDSKEGLFEACLSRASELLLQFGNGAADLAELPEFMSARVANAAPRARADDGTAGAMALVLRSTGDERAEKMRLGLLRQFSQSLATMAGWSSDRPEGGLLLRAELVIAVGIGVATLRLSGLEPLASASSEELSESMRKIVRSLLPEAG